jgi:hydroxyethylthiazole kinase-like uncharacterized protein yjeF
MKISTVAEMRQLDNKAVEEFGITREILMENAGEAVYFVIQKELGVPGKKFVVFGGSGNNGGDGFVVARKIHSNGGEVKVFLLSPREKYRAEAKKNLEIISRLPIDIREVRSIKEIRDDVFSADAIVDGIFGTGLDREVGGTYRAAIQLINESEKKVFAIDIASGVNGDSGQEMGCSIKADYTVTLGLPKVGNVLYPGYGRGGKLYVSHISFPPSLYQSDSMNVEVAEPVPIPPRNPDTTKMDYGPVLVIAGAANYFWAPHASAYSFLKAGGGYVYLACPASIAASVARRGREVVFHPQKETDTGSIAFENRDDLLELSARMKMVVLGPGLSLNEETQDLVRELARKIEKPLLIDGDGITAISRDTAVIKERKAETILTPHSGEMARLTGIERGEIEKNRVAVLPEAAGELNAFVVLKGPHSLIGCPDGRVFINVTGDTGGRAGMATAGSGDVLNGTISAMYCLGLGIEEAVRTGVFVHGLAGDMAAREKGPDGMTAQDILNSLPFAVRSYRENLAGLAQDRYDTIHVI